MIVMCKTNHLHSHFLLQEISVQKICIFLSILKLSCLVSGSLGGFSQHFPSD